MGDEIVEREFMGKGRSKIWTYLILMILLVAIVVVINLVWNNPSAAREGVKTFFGLPSYTLALVLFLAGAIIFWLGLKMETDWPEAFGAFLIAAAVTWGEFIIGWNRFAPGGLVVLPYVIPVGVFAILLIYGMKKSV
ncbi:MAG TPA: hypothetical protein VFQ53_37085 [Kofleriaceae bacterium]|nr:hypothetical protein [Kofleriaceae bacterium]